MSFELSYGFSNGTIPRFPKVVHMPKLEVISLKGQKEVQWLVKWRFYLLKLSILGLEMKKKNSLRYVS